MGISILTLATALGCALVAGVFFAFSSFVMRALARLPPAQGIAAMQSINVAVIHPAFMTAFLGTAAASLVLVILGALDGQEPGSAHRVAGGALYLLGSFLVTIACNVPRNDALAAVEPSSAEGARLWAGYLRGWTAWNHVRTLAALTAAAALALAI